MSVLIKGKLSVPRMCIECPFADDQGWCRADVDGRTINFETNERQQWCPLTELPPHGRLIDADVLLQRAVPHGWSTPKWVSDIRINDAPTIIEAEEGE